MTGVTVSIEWLLGVLIAFTACSYVFTWWSYKASVKGRAMLWDAVADIRTNDIKHLEERLGKIERINKEVL